MSDKTKDALLAGAVSAVSAVAVWLLVGILVMPSNQLLHGLISVVAGLGLGLAVAVRRLRRRESDANA